MEIVFPMTIGLLVFGPVVPVIAYAFSAGRSAQGSGIAVPEWREAPDEGS